MNQITFISLFNAGKKVAKSIAKFLQDCPNIQKITLVELEFESEDTQYIGDILYNNYPNFKVLKLSGIFLRDNLNYFLEGLRDNKYIQELSLQKMNLREESIPVLLGSLKNNIYLEILDISNNPIGDAVNFFCDDFEYFNCLKSLKMNNCDISDNNIENLLKSLEFNKSVKILELNNNKITNESKNIFVSFFNMNDAIKTIYLLKNKIGKRQISSIIKNKDLIKMVLEI